LDFGQKVMDLQDELFKKQQQISILEEKLKKYESKSK
jgi:hypothetical protein